MKTQAEIAAQKALVSKTCLNCGCVGVRIRRGQYVLKCALTGRIVPLGMMGCFFWKRGGER